jgi:hypothetical protein
LDFFSQKALVKANLTTPLSGSKSTATIPDIPLVLLQLNKITLSSLSISVLNSPTRCFSIFGTPSKKNYVSNPALSAARHETTFPKTEAIVPG